MSQPFDTHSYPVVPATESTNTGSQFGSTSEQYQDYSSQPQFSTSQNTSGLSGQNAYSGQSGLSSTGQGHSTTAGSSAAQQAMNNPGQTAANVTNKIVDLSGQAYNAAASHPAVQSIANGPVAQNLTAEAQKTSSEFSNLVNARQRPSQRAATGQHLTHYHSFFASLFSWENPRASAVAYAAVVMFIFGARYLDLLRYAFKISWMTLGVSAAAELAGQSLFKTGIVSQIRPRRYYTVPKETLDSMTGDLDELINFFVIETQRLVFAENVFATGAAFVTAFISYYLVKVVPFWGLSLIGSSVLFLTPLIYKQNKETIDAQIRHASRVVNQQTVQVKQVAVQQANATMNTTKHFVDEYSTKASQLIGQKSRQASATVQDTTQKAKNVASEKSQQAKNVASEKSQQAKNVTSEKASTTNTVPHADSTATGAYNTTSAYPVGSTSGLEPVGAASVLGEKPSGAYGMSEGDFPHAPKTDLATGIEGSQVPSVGDSTDRLRDDKPLYN